MKQPWSVSVAHVKDLLHILSCMLTLWKPRCYQSNGNVPLSSNATHADVGRHYSATALKVWNALKFPNWDVKGGCKRKVQPGMVRSNLSPVPPRLWPDLCLSPSHICHRRTFHLLGTAAVHHSCNLQDCQVLSRTHIVPGTPSSSSSSLYICIVVCSHNNRIHGNADPVVLNNKSG